MAGADDKNIGDESKTAVFANGCFWCTEAVFSMLKGVRSVVPGYAKSSELTGISSLAGNDTKGPTYEQVSGGNTGYAEAIKIDYDQSAISYDDLLVVFFNTHDPTTLNRQGNDVGTQYKSSIFYANDEQKEKAETLVKELNDSKAYDKPVVTEVKPLGRFFEAEDYHHQYYKHNSGEPYCQLVIAPKLEKLEKRFAELLKSRGE
jgi:peptide-methionine (S)-S-oxide reductase